MYFVLFLYTIMIKLKIYKIFLLEAKQLGIPFNKDVFLYLLQKWYRETGRRLQAVHARDLLRIVAVLNEYQGTPPQLTAELIDEACQTYFVQ